MWDSYERFSIKKKFAITILPAANASTPLRLNETFLSNSKVLCLQHYRAASDGWKDELNCDECVTQFREDLVYLSDCRLSDDCDCNVCRRQPPSLRNICSSIIFLKDSSFQLTPYTTFEEYVYAVELGAALIFRFLPPEFPQIRLWFRYDSFDRKFNRDCPGEGSWHAQISREFSSIEDAISALKDTEQKHILVFFL